MVKVSPSRAAPSAPVITRLRTKPVSRETRVPAAITALDFSSPEARPDFFGAGAGRGSGSGAGGGTWPGACWSR
ncbi:hypothetical protein STANM309S_03717 [Streptomyces tanashiensis]